MHQRVALSLGIIGTLFLASMAFAQITVTAPQGGSGAVQQIQQLAAQCPAGTAPHCANGYCTCVSPYETPVSDPHNSGIPAPITDQSAPDMQTPGADPTGQCPVPGTVPITPETRDEATAAGIPTSSPCWKPTDPNVGAETGQAKEYLRSILCRNSQFGGAGPDGTINGLDGKFAVCAAKFLKAESSQIPPSQQLLSGGTSGVCLREGYRTPQQQMVYYQEYLRGGGIACGKNGVQNCEHPRGIAIDVNTGSGYYEKLWNDANQFGVNFYLRSRDQVHFVPAVAACSGGGINPGTAPQTPLPPQYFDYPQQYQYPMMPPPATTPMSPFTNALRSMLGMPQSPVQNIVPPGSSLPASYQQSPTTQYADQTGQSYQGQSSGQTQIPSYLNQVGADQYPYYPSQTYPYSYPTSTQGGYYASGTAAYGSDHYGGNNSYQSSNITGGNTVTGNTTANPNYHPGHVTVTAPNGSTETTNASAQNAVPAGQIVNNGEAGGPNATGPDTGSLEELMRLANYSSSSLPSATPASTQTNSPAQINSNMQSQGGIQYTGGNSEGNPASANGQQGFAAPQTFTSGDLSGNPSFSTQPSSTFQKVLAQVESTLSAILTYVKPFGGRVPITNPSLRYVD